MDRPDDVSIHPAADLFPMMGDDEFAELVDDIRVNGLTHRIVRTPDGRILDGRNRYLACRELGVTPHYEVHAGEPWAFVVSTNLHRRHLTDAQRAMVAAKIAERHRGGISGSGRKSGNVPDGILPDPPPSQGEAQTMLQVSHGSLGRAKTVQQRGTQSLQQATNDGAVPLATAARVATTYSADEQDTFAGQVRAGRDPRRIAPPEKSRPQHGTAPPKPLAQKRYYRKTDTASREAITEVVNHLAGLAKGLEGIDAVDPAITDEEAARWVGSLSTGISAISKLRKLINQHQERTA